MTPERLAEIRRDVLSDSVGEERELLAEVDRLRAIEAGVKVLCGRWRGSANPALYMERDLRALLNPTEGGADHE